MNQRYPDDHTNTKGYEVYLHERDQFWPGIEMERIGQTQKIYIPLKTEVWGSFTMVQKTHLGVSAPCVTDSGYSYTRCMKDYVAASAGCHLDWVDKDNNNHYGQYDPCVTQDQVGLQNFTLNVDCLLWETNLL